MKIQFRLWRSS